MAGDAHDPQVEAWGRGRGRLRRLVGLHRLDLLGRPGVERDDVTDVDAKVVGHGLTEGDLVGRAGRGSATSHQAGEIVVDPPVPVDGSHEVEEAAGVSWEQRHPG